ncbi:hypothetical protein QR680_015413 [Steinernema hermaphroditum]|uniref:Uncharacterized protein n=1 Tax=Steinernema hermaphroditum TaxID=289476 RepID=A0AA39LKS8_9BILA|nr:hypothetical protein QR680_015413 [Steinernema hermaphroditum]
MGRRRRPAKKARQTLSTTQSTPDIIMLGADSPSPKRRRVRSQRQPDLIPEPDVICLSDDEDRFANDSFSNLGGRWFNNDITITLSDEEEYQRMADEVAAQSASSSDDNARWPSSSSNSSDGDAPELNISSEGQSVGKESRSGMGITGKFSFFSRFEGYMARIPPNCVRPQRGGHEREFPFKGRKRGTTLFRKICVAKERNGHKRAYGHGAHRPYNTQRGRVGHPAHRGPRGVSRPYHGAVPRVASFYYQ